MNGHPVVGEHFSINQAIQKGHKQMKITIFIGSISGGGAERVACNLANFLLKKHEVTMLTMSETPNAYGLHDIVRHISLITAKERKNKIAGNALRYFRLKRYLKNTECDCYLVMLPITTALLLHFKKICKAPIIASERNNPYIFSSFKRIMMRHYAKRADAWVFQTEDAAKWYEGIAKESVVIPNAINPAFIREPYVGEKEKSIVAAGRLSEQKNFKLLIEAFSKIAPDFPEYDLKIFGKGPLEQDLREYAAEKGVGERVNFMGYVDNMPEQLEKASLFVLSSDFEGMPNALMEAMALGLPCVSSDCPVGGPRFLIKDGENGLLVLVGDAEKMTEAMKSLLNDPEKAQIMGDNSREIANTLSPHEIYKKWESVITEISEK